MDDILKSGLYEAFAEAADNVYIYVTDMKTGVARWSKRAVEYFDLPGEYMDEPGELWGDHIHPDDKGIYFADIDAVFSGKRNHHSCQYRAMNRYGKYVWLECNGTMIYDEQGRQKIFAGMMTRLDSQSQYDPLTGLLAKSAFYDYDFSEGKGVVLLLGIDNFRRVISTYGYDFGNNVLVEFSKSLYEGCEGEQKAIRFNGDEFMLILPGIEKKDMMQLFSRVQDKTKTITMSDGREISLTISAGAECYPINGGNKDDLVNRLELAMDYVKRVNKGNLAFYSGTVEAKQLRRIELKQDLKRSIADDFAGFELYYQPWVDAHGTGISGCEALLRWKGKNIKDSGPVEFIPILEEDDSIIEVGRWVMRNAMQQQKRWQDRYGEFKVSFNVSYRQFMEKGYVEEVVAAAKEFGVTPGNMVIELTESCDVETPEKLAIIFEKLREHGFQIALDDFGTGYASMELLKKLPADEIKIEHNFVRGLERTGHGVDFAIIEAIMMLCNRLNCGIVVEGVENEEVDKIIRDMDATYLQGYYYSKPICREDFDKLMVENAKNAVTAAREYAKSSGAVYAKNESLDKMIVNAFAGTYESLHMLNLKEDIYQEYQASDRVHKLAGYSGVITGTFNRMIGVLFSGESLEAVFEFLDLNTVDSRLKGKTMIVRDFSTKKFGTYRMSFIPVKYDEQGHLENVLFAVQKLEDHVPEGE